MNIQPKDHNINEVFSSTKYYIDFYQRDYKWQHKHVESLLDDIFYKFDSEYKSTIDVNQESISQFGWYYLSTYVTNNLNEKVYIVDGQQRFTTLTLILIKLYHQAKTFRLDERTEWLSQKIYGMGAEGKSFWMGQNNRRACLEDLFKHGKKTISFDNESISIHNMFRNYEYISEQLNGKLNTPHKCEAFILYFLRNIKLVEIIVGESKDVSMVFEVINDRGERLKPYEIFKGKLLGQLDKSEVNQYYRLWSSKIYNLQNINEKEVDKFFISYFRAKAASSKAEQDEFDNDYYKTVFSKKWNDTFELKRNPVGVKEFLNNEFEYYANLYKNLLEKAKDETSFLYFNSLNGLDRQYQLLLSAIDLKDDNEEKKISLVAQLFDRHFTLLQLLGCYDSNRFTESIVALNENIRNKNIDEIRQLFDKQLIDDINIAKNLSIQEPLQWALFKEANINNMNKRFAKYFFARVDHFIASEIEKPTIDYHTLVKKTGRDGYHIEHILAQNEENKMLFNNDEELFFKERSKLGALLLLKGRDNQSSGKEPYHEKLKTYSHGPLWAQTLTQDFYHANKGIDDLKNLYNLNIEPIEHFDQSAIDKRQKLLFDIISVLWGKIDTNKQILSL